MFRQRGATGHSMSTQVNLYMVYDSYNYKNAQEDAREERKKQNKNKLILSE